MTAGSDEPAAARTPQGQQAPGHAGSPTPAPDAAPEAPTECPEPASGAADDGAAPAAGSSGAAAEPAADSSGDLSALAEAPQGGSPRSRGSRGPPVTSLASALESVTIADALSANPGGFGSPSAPMSPSEPWNVARPAASPSSSGFSRASVKSPVTSHPLQDSGSPRGSPSGSNARAYGLGAAPASVESEHTAFSSPIRYAGSPRASMSPWGIHAEIAEAGEAEADPVDEYERRQRRLFRAAEKRRLQREQMSRDSLSSEDIEAMRSGLSNAREFAGPSELHILNGAFPDGLAGTLYLLGPGHFDIRYNVQRELEQATRVFTYGHIMDVPPLLSSIMFDPRRKAIVHRSRLIAKQATARVHMEHGITTKVPGALYMSDTNQTALGMLLPKPTHRATAEGECCGQAIQLAVPLQGSSRAVVCTNHVGALQCIDPDDLRPTATVELKSINRAFKGALSCPHMQYDPRTREHFTVLQDVGFRSTTYTVVAICEAQPGGYVVAKFAAQASVLHSFAITQDYVVVPVYPYSAPIGGMAYRWSDSLLETLSFDNDRPVLFYVISREYRRVQCVYRAPAFFALHQINAVQETATDSVFLDMAAYADDTVLRRLQVKDLRRPSFASSIPAGELRRFQLGNIAAEASRYAGLGGGISRLPLAHSLVLRTEPVELAQISPAAAMRNHTFVYGLSQTEALRGQPGAEQPNTAAMYNCIVKLDVSDRSAPAQTWSRTHCYPSEPVFVPRGDKEDDGYVLSVFFDSMRITSCLLVLDARSFKELLIAQLPAAMPISFGHSRFAP
ncbi:hypothetical protein LPJ61_004141 [Coemansia biformis]|uniref:Uncharacterized protein n=1 Tax=Coemansia biformis TaxID=1286918 RepID=A0A9W7YA29_9FUNG|nr:hypothetical protein LPJ61_004141 [Coemansia biformis]